MVMPRTAYGTVQSDKQDAVVNLNKVRAKKVFSNIHKLGFNLLSTGIAKTLIKSPLTLLNASVGELKITDPALLLTLDVLGQNRGVMYLSLNASKDEVIAKLILALSGVTEENVKRGALIDKIERESFDKACSIIYNAKIYVAEDDGVNSLWIKAAELKASKDVDIIIIDDFHTVSFELLNDEKNNHQDVLEHFNEMAVNIGLPVVLIYRTA
jgi:replicative DNA helicase